MCVCVWGEKNVKSRGALRARSRYSSNQTRAHASNVYVFIFIFFLVCRRRRFDLPCVMVGKQQLPFYFNDAYSLNKHVREASRSRGKMNPTLSKLRPGALPSHLKVRFIGFKEFGSGDGPLPQSLS